jgi:hypothetical protein
VIGILIVLAVVAPAREPSMLRIEVRAADAPVAAADVSVNGPKSRTLAGRCAGHARGIVGR